MDRSFEIGLHLLKVWTMVWWHVTV